MSNNAESKVPENFAKNSSNEWIYWIKEAIAKDYFEYYEFNQFSNFQEIGFGDFGKVYRANWKSSRNCLALKSFFIYNNTTIKEIVKELKIQCEVNFHENIIRLCGITIENQNDNSKKYWLVMEYAESSTLREYLKENFDSLTWIDKFNMALQLACAILCLHDKEIIHCNLHSKNVLVHQNIIKLADFGLSKRIEESSNLQPSTKLFEMIPYTDPKNFGNQNYELNKKSDIYSIGVLLWEISSGKPPFYTEGKPYDICLAINISQGLREKPILNTPKDYANIYTDCWNNEPDSRLPINQVVSKLNAIVSTNNKDFQSDQLSSKQQLNLNAFEDSKNISLPHGELSKIIQRFNKIDIEEIDPSMITPNYSFMMIIVDEIVELLDKIAIEGEELDRQSIYRYLNNHNITTQEIYNWILNNQNHSNSIVLLGDFNYLGIVINADKKKAFEFYQIAANLGNIVAQYNLGCCYQYGNGTDKNYNRSFELFERLTKIEYSKGINYLGYCYKHGIGTAIDEQKAFELCQKAANLGNTYSMNNLGDCYEKGIGTYINLQNAFKLYQKSANLGNTSGMINLGDCYKYGIGTYIDKKKAFELYQKAADFGDTYGMSNLGDCYEKGIGTDIDAKKALKLYQKVADLGDATGINNLGDHYHYGIGTDIDKKKALELYQKAAYLGNTTAMNNLAYYYGNGIETGIDKKKAFELYQKSADLGNAYGMVNLGNFYEKGIGTDVDEKKAFESFKKAADLGNASGLNNLGYYYEFGMGTESDEKKAFELYQKAADLGNSVSQYNLALMYENGIGVAKSISQAIFWYEKSALKGNQDAQNKLSKLV
ncbi:hypothetical protein RclHR1_05800003 [Rhizophagus clarus]|uniref:Kinase-like domain-containing protein n=1 Tax=Rhizophagus clarus TaxID=94130 RepID=A0A2Z6RPC0_9GLOM|nr:hypothetical protein RclHR1_05800003 [Rhizophagus clarus]GES88032.1 kinase-like domain-containing protein [Rhizophagus clarus]